MTDTNQAFHEAPPAVTIDGKSVQLKQLTEWIWSFLTTSFKGHEQENSMFIAGYIFAASRPGAEVLAAKRDGTLFDLCEAMVLDLTEEDTQAVLDYCEAVVERKNGAQVSIPDGPGKPETATTPES